MKHVYDCDAGFNNWKYGWSSAKQAWCCAHQKRGCPGSWEGHGLTKMVVTKVTSESHPPKVELVEGVKVAIHGALEGQTLSK